MAAVDYVGSILLRQAFPLLCSRCAGRRQICEEQHWPSSTSPWGGGEKCVPGCGMGTCATTDRSSCDGTPPPPPTGGQQINVRRGPLQVIARRGGRGATSQGKARQVQAAYATIAVTDRGASAYYQTVGPSIARENVWRGGGTLYMRLNHLQDNSPRMAPDDHSQALICQRIALQTDLVAAG